MSWNCAIGPTLAKEETRPPTAGVVDTALEELVLTGAGTGEARLMLPCICVIKAASIEGDGK